MTIETVEIGICVTRKIPLKEIVNARIAESGQYNYRRCIAVDSLAKTYYIGAGAEDEALNKAYQFISSGLNHSTPKVDGNQDHYRNEVAFSMTSFEGKQNSKVVTFPIRSKPVISEKVYWKIRYWSIFIHAIFCLFLVSFSLWNVLACLIMFIIEFIFLSKILRLAMCNPEGEYGKVTWDGNDISFVGQIFNKKIEEKVPIKSISAVFLGSMSSRTDWGSFPAISIKMGSEIRNFIPKIEEGEALRLVEALRDVMEKHRVNN
ncbi:MAG: hypothetical protein EOP04_00260 [Proteobacteria bacterium]|nr:MAG: hypothetical protein EOP04_00260 [Pseudomonadota bacterium]